MTTYKPKEVEEKTGIPTRRIQFYVESGLISIGNPGRGASRRFTEKNLLELLLIAELAKNGIELNKIKKIFLKGRKIMPAIFDPANYQRKNPTRFFIIIYGGGELISFRNRIVLDLINWNGALCINLSGLYERDTI